MHKISRRFYSSTNKKVDFLIVGGGPVGSSIAYHLAKAGAKNITVLEQDLSYQTASAMLSAGGIRQQFSVPENVKMQIYGAAFIKNKEALAVNGELPDLQFHENGYLFLSTEKSKSVLEENVKMQHEVGAKWIQAMTPKDLNAKFPWLNTEDLALGTFGTANEGYFDPWLYVNALRKKNASIGVEYYEGRVIGGALVPSTSSSTSSYKINHLSTINPKEFTGNMTNISAGVIINAAGAWSGRLIANLASNLTKPHTIHPLPVNPKKRCIFSIHCRTNEARPLDYEEGKENADMLYPAPPSNIPLVVDPSGVYFRPEINRTGHFILGVSPPEEQDPDVLPDQEKDALLSVDHHLFDDIIWPALAHRVPTFQEIKVTSSWAGFYDYNSLDQNGIIGQHSEIDNMMICAGFSGHGLMQSPAAGRAVAELVLNNHKYQTLDLSRFSFERIVKKEPIFEKGII